MVKKNANLKRERLYEEGAFHSKKTTADGRNVSIDNNLLILGIFFGHIFLGFFFTFFAYKWQTPRKNVHEVGQPIWMRTTVELSDVHNIVLVFKHSSLVEKKGKIRISTLFEIWNEFLCPIN